MTVNEYGPLNLLSPFAAILANFLCQLALCRLADQKGMTTVFVASLFGWAVMLALELLLDWRADTDLGAASVRVAVNSLIYLGMAACLFFLYGLGFSIRIRVLAFMNDKGAPAGLAEIEKAVYPVNMLRQRLERLHSQGQIARDGDTYRERKAMLFYIAKINLAFKRLLTGRSSEFIEADRMSHD